MSNIESNIKWGDVFMSMRDSHPTNEATANEFYSRALDAARRAFMSCTRGQSLEAAILAYLNVLDEKIPFFWPDFVAPPKYDNPADGWTDPKLPDFRLIWATARECGYAVGLHGSMKRDCDLIAVPWVDSAVSHDGLIAALCKALDANEVGAREPKPNGRIAVNLQVNGWVKLIDLSIYAVQPHP